MSDTSTSINEYSHSHTYNTTCTCLHDNVYSFAHRAEEKKRKEEETQQKHIAAVLMQTMWRGHFRRNGPPKAKKKGKKGKKGKKVFQCLCAHASVSYL